MFKRSLILLFAATMTLLAGCQSASVPAVAELSGVSSSSSSKVESNTSSDKTSKDTSKTTSKQESVDTSKEEELPEELTAPNESSAESQSSVFINDFEPIIQTPELPTGCEITALAMLINYYTHDVDKTVLASQYLPKIDAVYLTYDSDGKLIGPDINHYFWGDPFTDNHGFVCGTGAILTAATNYLADRQSTHTVMNMSGSDVQYLYESVQKGTPVMVWITIGMQDRVINDSWYTESGELMDWGTLDHAGVLIGYNETNNTVIFADPLAGIVTYDKAQFEKVFTERGKKCVVIK